MQRNIKTSNYSKGNKRYGNFSWLKRGSLALAVLVRVLILIQLWGKQAGSNPGHTLMVVENVGIILGKAYQCWIILGRAYQCWIILGKAYQCWIINSRVCYWKVLSSEPEPHLSNPGDTETEPRSSFRSCGPSSRCRRRSCRRSSCRGRSSDGRSSPLKLRVSQLLKWSVVY